MTPSIRQIRAFLSVANHLKFTTAAEELHVSQPALTVQIRQLEERLGIRLFDRNKRQVSLTSAGRELMPLFQRIMSGMDQVMNASTDISQAQRGVVRVAALPSVAARLVPMAMARLNEHYPHIRIELHDVVAERIVEMVKYEDVDFGIGTRLTPDRDIKVESLLTDQICAFFPKGHPLERAGETLKLADCAGYPLVLTQTNSSIRILFERAVARENLEISIASKVHYMSTALGIARANLGVAILPKTAVDAGSVAGLLCKRIEAPSLNRRIGIIRRADRSFSPVTERFLRVLREVNDQSGEAAEQ